MQTLRNPELYPIIIIGILVLLGFIVFWSVMDMVVLSASLAIVLLPLHHRLSARIRPIFSALLITGGILAIAAATLFAAFQILTANGPVLSTMFAAIGRWLGDPATNPLSYGVPFGKTRLIEILNEADALFVNYQNTLVDNLSLVLFKIFVFFFSLGALLFHGDLIKNQFLARVPAVLRTYIGRLSSVTVDTLYAIYVVQVAIAVLTFFIAIPVFYLLGYGNIFFYSFLAAFCELIPVLGSSATFLLIGAYALALGDTRGVFILFILGYLVVSCVPEIWIRPVLVGRRVRISPVIMFIGIIGGILTMGLAGFVLGPVMIVLLINSFRIYANERRERRKHPLPGESSPADI